MPEDKTAAADDMAELHDEITAEMEKDLGSTVRTIPRKVPSLSQPLHPPKMPRTGIFKVSDIKEERPERAADQIAMACAGLLKAEDELRKLAHDICGDDLHLSEIEDVPSTERSLLPRLRGDAELMARLAIRLVKLCEEVRSKL